MTQEISKAISTRCEDKSVDGGRKTVAALEIMRTDILEKMTDINETWADVKNNGESSQATKIVLSHAGKASARSTKRAIRQLDEFKKEELAWQKQISDYRYAEWEQTAHGLPNSLGWAKQQQQAEQATVLPDHNQREYQERAEKMQS